MAGWYSKDINPALVQQANTWGNVGNAFSNLGTSMISNANTIDENQRKQDQLGLLKTKADQETDTYNISKKKQQENDTAYTNLGKNLKDDFIANPDKYKDLGVGYKSMLSDGVDPRIVGENVGKISDEQFKYSKLGNALTIAENKNDAYKTALEVRQGLGEQANQVRQMQVDAYKTKSEADAQRHQDELVRRTAADNEKTRQFDEKQKENEFLKGKSELVKTLSTNPRAVLGEGYSTEALSQALNDAMAYGKVGTMATVPGKLWGTNSKYVPYSPQQTAQPVQQNNNDPLGLRK